jgi:hypothetical protein
MGVIEKRSGLLQEKHLFNSSTFINYTLISLLVLPYALCLGIIG